MAQATDIAIVAGARTPMGRYCGKLRAFTAMEVGGILNTARDNARATITSLLLGMGFEKVEVE